jgi:aspartate/methionine/tyrosine aminotransferase
LESAVTPKTKGILLNTPWNPTGTVMSRAELQAVGAFAETHDLFVIVDEIYNRLIFDGGRHVSIAALSEALRHRTITVNGFSKTFAMTGWRLGYLIADREICGPATRLNHHTGRCATSFVQAAGVEALTGPQDSVREMVAAYQRRRDLMLEGLRPIAGLRPVPPEGTFYMLVDHSSFGLTTAAFAQFLLEEAGVVVTPGDYFGQLGEGYVRLSFCNTDENIRAALDRIASAVPKLARVRP